MASTSVDRERTILTRDIRYAEDSLFRAGLARDSAEAALVRAVTDRADALSAASKARATLTTFEASLCATCGCLNADHTTEPFDDDPRTGDWLCYDCGREEACGAD